MARPPNPFKPGVAPKDSLDTPVKAGSFLERRSYRRRRMTDGLRLLPVFGLWLFMVPMLWPGAAASLTGSAVSMSSALIYIFAVWFALILLCGQLSVSQAQDTDSDERKGPPGAGAP